MKISTHSSGKLYTTLTIDGKKNFIYGDTEDEVEKAYIEMKYKHNMGYDVNSDPTIEEYAIQWFKAFKEDQGSLSSRRMYKNCVYHHIIKKLGKKRLKELTGTQAKTFIKGITSSKSLANKVRITLNQIYKQAIEDRIMVFNPVASCKATAPDNPKRKWLSDTQRDLFLQITEGTKFYPIGFTMLYTGMRMGELIALKRKRDIDLKKDKIKIDEATEFDHSKPKPKAPKTKRGYREIPIVPDLHVFLEQYLKGNNTLYVFPGHAGGQMGLSEITSLLRSANKRVDKYFDTHPKMEEHRFHITFRLLRHTYCTGLYDAGVDELSAAEIMGHDVEVMRKIYTHIQKSRRKQTVTKVANIYKNKESTSKEAK